VLEFLNNLWGLGTKQEQGCRTGPPGYTACRNGFLGIDSWTPSKFKNSGSVDVRTLVTYSLGHGNVNTMEMLDLKGLCQEITSAGLLNF
jgi:hypothetical protein